ncbi:MAG: DNA-processing protein DprA, partial [Acidimicrobiales bacterium]
MNSYAAALAGLPGMGPARLAAILGRWSPEEAWRRVVAGTAHLPGCEGGSVSETWRHEARRIDPASVAAAHRAAKVDVHVNGQPSYPEVLAADHEAPAVLFSLGDVAALDGRRVGIVGTRACSRYGRDVAYQLGRDLAASGVRVVSGLALGVDGAAHGGVLD